MATHSTPKISVIMIDGSFRESYHAVDFFCNQTLPAEDYELIWVEFYKNANPQLKEKIDKYPNARLVTLDKEGIYHSSLCFNAGINESRGEVIFIPDGDVAVEKFFLETALKEHEENHKLVMYFFRKEEAKEIHKTDISLDYLKDVCTFTNPANYGGCLSIRKKWLLEINGYEQHPVFGSGFHANGVDMYTRFKNKGLHVMWHPELILYHPWHPLNAAGFPVWETQKTITNYRARHLLFMAYQGIDPKKNRELEPELGKLLEKAKKIHKLDEVFDSWYNLKKDPGKSVDDEYTKQFLQNQGKKKANKKTMEKSQTTPSGQTNPQKKSLLARFTGKLF